MRAGSEPILRRIRRSSILPDWAKLPPRHALASQYSGQESVRGGRSLWLITLASTTIFASSIVAVLPAVAFALLACTLVLLVTWRLRLRLGTGYTWLAVAVALLEVNFDSVVPQVGAMQPIVKGITLVAAGASLHQTTGPPPWQPTWRFRAFCTAVLLATLLSLSIEGLSAAGITLLAVLTIAAALRHDRTLTLTAIFVGTLAFVYLNLAASALGLEGTQSDQVFGETEFVRLAGVTGPNALGRACALALVLAYLLRRDIPRTWLLVATPLPWVLVSTDSRTALFSLIMALAAAALTRLRYALLVASLASYASPLLITQLGGIAVATLRQFGRGGDADSVVHLSGRTSIWEATRSAILQPPWFGHGFVNPTQELVSNGLPITPASAHSDILQVGLVAGVLVVIIVLASAVTFAMYAAGGDTPQSSLIVLAGISGTAEALLTLGVPTTVGLVLYAALFFPGALLPVRVRQRGQMAVPSRHHGAAGRNRTEQGDTGRGS